MRTLNRTIPLLARLLLALIFIASGFSKIPGWHDTAALMASKGIPFVPLSLAAAIGVEIGGGVSVLLGFKTRVGAAALVVFLIPTTLIFHNFWALEGMDRQINMIMFMKNLAIIGGLLLLAVFGAGPLSLDSRDKERERAAGAPAVATRSA